MTVKSMKLKLAGMALVGVALCAFSEPMAPDMQQIRAEVTDPDSRYYYPKLMAEYARNDTSVLTSDDYRRLYLGAVFQEDFNPYRHSAYAGLLEELYYKSHHSRSECDSIIKYANISLKDNPFDLQQINYLIYALREKKKNNLANIWQYRLNHLLEAIAGTGTGLSPENAWYVIYPQHEYYVVNLLGRVAEGQEFEAPCFDRISLRPRGEKDPSAYYFNVRPILEQYLMKFPVQEENPAEDFSVVNEE